ncbi:MAG: inorganic diphosphatase [Candidatus Paceibacterota bacterium]|jgi:inorganic pyrophosphatase
MKHTSLFHRVKQEKAPETLSLIVEISEGDYNKYEYNHDLDVLEVDRVLYGPMFYPINYCDVPGTWNEHDNDPLDALLFSSQPIVPGALVKGRVIGLMEMIDNGEIDHKIVCVNAKDPRFDHVQTTEDLTPYQRKDIVTFFELYKIPQTGKDTTKVGKFISPQEAGKFILECVEAYQKKFGDNQD